MKRPKLKKASKRMTCHKRYKIQKKVREHNRKLRKEAKKRGNKKPKKDLGIPNAAPFKEEVLREAQQRKQRLEELKQKQKLDRQKEFEKKRKQEANKKDNNKIKKSTAGEKSESKQQLDKNSKKSFCKELKKVIESSDVVLEVLDARDPLGSRCPELEQLIGQLDGEKKLLLVLNKIDLVPKENLEKWLKYLNNEIPTVAFKSSMLLKDKTVQEKKRTKNRSAYIELSRASMCFGKECLLKLLQEYSTHKDRVIQVGVVGFPNVGKSSIINSLKDVRACNVGPIGGLTKCNQTVHIDKQIRMFDSPCIIAAPSNSPLALALRSTTDLDGGSLIGAVDAILKHCSKQQIMLYYNISDYRSPLEFLSLLAQKRGMLKKGGLADIEGAAKLLLHDWTGAKVNYYSRPPEAWDLSAHLTREASAAAQQNINLEDLEEDNKSTMKANKYPNQASCIVFQSPGFTNGIIEENKLPDEVFEQEEMEGSEDELMEGENEDDIGSDSEGANEGENRTESSAVALEDLKATQAHVEKLSTDNQVQKEKANNIDDAYDFTTDYI